MTARWLLILASCFAAAVPAHAQEAVETYFSLCSSDRAQVNLRKQADCVVRKYPADARRVVIDDLEMRTIINSMPGLTKPCYSAAWFKDNTVAISQPVFGFVLAEVLVGSLPAVPSLDGIATAPPLVRDASPGDVSALPAKMRQDVAIAAELLRLDAAAECAVRHDPKAAWALATARPASDVEDTTLKQMEAAILNCDKASVSAPPFIVRGFVAFNLYRLLDAAHLVGGGKDQVSA